VKSWLHSAKVTMPDTGGLNMEVNAKRGF